MSFRCFAARRWTALLVLLAFLLPQLCPVPARAFFFGGVSIKDEKEMGHKFDVMVRSSLPVVEDPEVSQYVKYLLDRLVKALPPQPYSFKATVVLHNSLNAFAVPGGYVFVFTGMIMNLDREDELAGVLAHELAHVTQRHVAARLERAQYLTVGSLLLAIAGVAAGGPGGGALAIGAMGAGQSAMLNYSRVDESEADHIGLQYLTAAGYPPSGMVGGFKVLRQKSWMSGTSVPAYLSTHPAIGDRINGLQARIQTMPADIRDRKLDNRRFIRVKTLLWARYGDEQAALQRFSGKDGLSAMGRGIVLARQNKINEASTAFDQALAAAPSDPLVLREAGAFHYRKGDMTAPTACCAKPCAWTRAITWLPFSTPGCWMKPAAKPKRTSTTRKYCAMCRKTPRCTSPTPAPWARRAKPSTPTSIWLTAPCTPTIRNKPSAFSTRPRPWPAARRTSGSSSGWKRLTRNARKSGIKTDGYSRDNHTGSEKRRPRGHGR